MATKKKASSGSDPRSKKTVQKKIQSVMHEFKRHELESGASGKKVRNPKQAIAIALSEARRAGANIPPNPNANKKTSKKTVSRKSAYKKSTPKER